MIGYKVCRVYNPGLYISAVAEAQRCVFYTLGHKIEPPVPGTGLFLFCGLNFAVRFAHVQPYRGLDFCILQCDYEEYPLAKIRDETPFDRVLRTYKWPNGTVIAKHCTPQSLVMDNAAITREAHDAWI